MDARSVGTAEIRARLLAHVRGRLAPEERAAVERELDANPGWLAIVAQLARETDDVASGAGPRDASTRTPDRIGRHRIVGVLGSGGHAVVLDARDPRLGRPVAIKLLHGTIDAVRRERFAREARALAHVRHPNLIQIFDVGIDGDRPYLAMERLHGATLRAHLRAHALPWRAIVGLFVDAARGLAALHRAGWVHRDVTPNNVFVTRDGRVVVLDLGIVSRVERGAVVVDPVRTSASGSDTGTLTHAAVGTIPYMAPEQRRGEACTPATDQYALCVMLFEALHGWRPPSDPAVDALARRWPRALDELLARGLASDPQRRHADMPALVESLEAIAAADRGRLRPALALGAAAMIATIAIAGARGSDALPAVEAAPPPSESVTPSVDVAGDIVALRHAGLVREARELGIQRIAAASSADERARVSLALAGAVLDDGEPMAARALLESAADAAAEAGRDDLAALAWARLAAVTANHLGDGAGAAEIARRADAWSERAGRPDDVEAERWLAQAEVEQALERRDAVLVAVESAAEAIARLPDDTAERCRLRAEIHDATAQAQRDHGRWADAAAHWDAAAALVHACFPDNLGIQASLEVNAASLSRVAGRYDESEGRLFAALALVTEAFDPRHPRVAVVLANLAVAHLNQRRLDLAAHDIAAALAIYRAAGQPSATVRGVAEVIAAEIEVRRGAIGPAIVHYRSAVESTEAALGPAHPRVGALRLDLAEALFRLERYAEARDEYAAALAILEASSGGHPELARVFTGLGQIAMIEGHRADGIAAFERAAAVADASWSAYAHLRLGQALAEQGRDADARRAFARARDPGVVALDPVRARELADEERGLRVRGR